MAADRPANSGHDLGLMLREVTQPNGVRRLLKSLASQVGGWAMLLDQTGEPVAAAPAPPKDLLPEIEDAIGSVVACRRQSASIELGSHSVWIIAVGQVQPCPILVVAKHGSFPADAVGTVMDAVRLLGLRVWGDGIERKQGEVKRAEALTREAVLHLLMAGHLDGARRVAGALRPELPDRLRVCVVECGAGERDEYADRCFEASGRTAWIVRCPVYDQQLIVLAPAVQDRPESAEFDAVLQELIASGRDVHVGVGPPVALRDTASGYEQAFHAVAMAKHDATRFATFGPATALSALFGRAGQEWAASVLEPLLDFTPERSQDPDGDELLSTLRSWLSFYGKAAAQLKVHRNTVSIRLRRIERILGRDLDDVTAQAILDLALRLLNRSIRPRSGQVPELDDLLDAAPVRQWARTLLSPVLDNDSRLALTTLRTWLGCDARLEETAVALGISVPGARKRLLRIEGILGRSLLNGPSARYDVVLALRALDGRVSAGGDTGAAGHVPGAP
ncbi:helix-turn-helix domain-containing protein [Saccharopolyspora indica]|nr:helix-turn-helix domain-containing protein [Saccharopolyspora indica]